MSENSNSWKEGKKDGTMVNSNGTGEMVDYNAIQQKQEAKIYILDPTI